MIGEDYADMVAAMLRAGFDPEEVAAAVRAGDFDAPDAGGAPA